MDFFFARNTNTMDYKYLMKQAL